MFGSKKNKEPSMPALNQPVDTLISQHCVIEGNLITQNSIKLDGRVHGNLLAKGHVIVGEPVLILLQECETKIWPIDKRLPFLCKIQ